MAIQSILQNLAAGLSRTPAYHAAVSLLMGCGGGLVLVMFLSTLWPTERLLALLPWVVGFNAAVSGYRLGERRTGITRHRHLWAVGTGSGVALLLVFLVAGYLTRISGLPVIWHTHLALTMPIGAIMAELGTLLAIRYKQIATEQGKEGGKRIKTPPARTSQASG